MSEVRDSVCSFDNLYQSMKKCRRGVMWKDSVARFSNNGLVSILKLQESLLDGSYTIDDYYAFTIYEPKKREIVSTRFKDRVFQRSLCDNYLYHQLTKGFIYDNSACQTKKGTDFARKRLTRFLENHYRKYGAQGYVLKCDIKDYFGQTSHEVAKQAVAKRVPDEWAREHVYQIIDSYGDTGMGLGSQVTQLIQLAVLDDLDHIIKEKLRIKHYLRSMDDMVAIHPDKDVLLSCFQVIDNHLKSLGLSLNLKKSHVMPLGQGINHLGYKFRLTDTGKVVRTVLKPNIKKYRMKLCKYHKLHRTGRMTKDKMDVCYIAWKAHLAKGDNYKTIRRMDSYYNSLWEAGHVQKIVG